MHCFASLAEAWVRLSAFQKEYNTVRPHSSLGDLAPQMFKTAWNEAQAKTQETNIPT
jgi:putative transposase